jgi:hypothetical protein
VLLRRELTRITGTINRWYEEQAENVRRFLAGEELLNRLN